MTRGGTQVVGNIGMYFAAYRLSLMGWNIMPTARNARGIDLLAYNTTADRYLGIQVKALSKPKPPVPLGKSVDTFMGDYWIQCPWRVFLVAYAVQPALS